MTNNGFRFTSSFKLKQFFLYLFWYLPGYVLCLIVFRLLNTTLVLGSPPKFHKGGALLVSNHQSALDSWFVGHLCFPRPVWFPAKSELFTIPIVKFMISGWRAFPVKRGQHDYQAMDFMVALLSQYLVLIHPEGTRNPTRELLPGKIGVGKVIRDAQCAVIPVYFEGMAELLPKGAYFPRFGKTLKIVFGSPLDLTQYYLLPPSKDVSRKIVDEVMHGIKQQQDRLLAL